jgi:hypothetical protein
LAGGYVVIREAEDPLTNRRKPEKPVSGSPDILSAGAVPRRSNQNVKDNDTDIRKLVTI